MKTIEEIQEKMTKLNKINSRLSEEIKEKQQALYFNLDRISNLQWVLNTTENTTDDDKIKQI